MRKITVFVSTKKERERAEYVSLHWQEISYELNGIYFEINDGESPSFDAGDGVENDPAYIKLYNAIFSGSDDA